MSGKHRSLSEEAASMSEDDESEVELTASIKCHSPPSQITDLLERYYMACNKIINEVKKYQSSYPGSLYSLSPVVVARNVSPDCLAALPSFVKEYKVKSQVVTGDLYILELGISREHGRGVLELGGQARDWKNSHRRSSFVLTTDSVYEKGEKGAAPDLVISVHDNYKDDPTDLKVVVVELEVSNRSVSGMRRDYAGYFNQDSMLSVIGIKVFPKEECPCLRAAAVQWTISAGTIEVTSAIDFGVLPLSASTLNAFAVAPEGGALPAVRPEQWQRFSPLPADMLGDSTRFSDAELLVLSEWVIRNDMVDLYPLGQPEIQIDGEQLSTRLVPMGGVPITAADIGNLVIKLKPMFYIITEAAGILARSLHK